MRAIRRVAAGEAMLSPAVTRRLIEHVADRPARTRAGDARPRRCSTGSPSGSARSRWRSAQGRSNAEIGAELLMSVATVKAHVSRLLTKLELNNRVQIALLVHDAGAA